MQRVSALTVVGSAAFILFGYCMPASAQDQLLVDPDARKVRVLRAPYPKSVILKRGTILRFEGKSSQEADWLLTCSGRQVARQKCGRRWAVEWNPSEQRRFECDVALAYAPINAPLFVTAVRVILVQDPPFFIESPKPNEIIAGSIGITVRTTGRFHAESMDILLDDVPTGSTLDKSGQGKFDTSTLAPGRRQISILVHTSDEEFKTEPVPFTIPVTITIPRLIRLRPLPADRVPSLVEAEVDSTVVVESVVFLLDGKAIGSKSKPPFAVPISLAGLKPGKHTLAASVQDVNRIEHMSPEVTFLVDTRDIARSLGPLGMAAWQEAVLARLDSVLTEQETLDRLVHNAATGSATPRYSFVPIVPGATKSAQALTEAENETEAWLKLLPLPNDVSDPSDLAALTGVKAAILRGLAHIKAYDAKMRDILNLADSHSIRSIGDFIAHTHNRLPDGTGYPQAEKVFLSEKSKALQELNAADRELVKLDNRLNIERSEDHHAPFGTAGTHASG